MGQAARTHRPGLDGLRGLAVAAVIAYHLDLLRGGFFGVDVFFVLSGYLITGLVLAEVDAQGSMSLRGFWSRRVRRLVPALVAMVVVVVGAALALGWPSDERRDLAIDATATVTWWANWRQAGGSSYWASGEDPFRHAWSLSIEEQFYVLWPLVVLAVVAVLVRRGRPAQLPIALGAVAAVGAIGSAAWMVALSHRLADADLSRAYVGTDTRVFAPLLGCALACAAHRWPERWDGSRSTRAGGVIGLAVLVGLVAVVEVSSPSTYRWGLFPLAALAAAALVRAAALADAADRDPVGWVVTRPATRYLGTRSYALYLWSWPIQVLVAFRFPDLARAALVAVTLLGSLAIAELSQRVVEVPLRHRSGWAAAPRLRRPAWAMGAAAAVVVVALSAASSTPPPRHQTVESAEAAEAALRPPEPTTTAAGPTTTVPGEPAPLRVMLAGDSVAWTVGYYRPQDGELPEGIASIDSRAIIGCGLLAGEGWEYPQGGDGPFSAPAAEACAEQPEAERLGFEGAPDVLLLFPGAWEWPEARSPDGRVVGAQSAEMRDLLRTRLLDKVRAAHEVGARTVLVEWACPGPEADERLRDPSYVAWINDLMAEVATAGEAEGVGPVEVLAPTEAICEGGDSLGAPTPAKAEATGSEIHVVSFEGGRWIWDAWLAPALRSLAR